MNAEEIMTTPVTTVAENATVGEALELLESLDVRHLPVTRDAELVGMISDRDLRDAGLSLMVDFAELDRIAALRRQPVSEIMTPDPVTVDPNESVRDVIDRMTEERVGALPVVRHIDGTLVGIISYLDVMRNAADRM